MKNINQIITKLFITILLASFMFSCKKMLDVDPKTVIKEDEHYQNEFDAQTAVLGVAGLFQKNVVEKYVLLGELRGDLLDITSNADEYMQQIALHQADTSNPYINPGDFYKVILTANDALNNLQKMRELEKIKEDEFEEKYSNILAYQCFTYYILGLHFGTVPYFTTSINDIDDLKNLNVKKLTFDELIDSLIFKMGSLPKTEESYGYITDASTSASKFINKLFFTGDLYLMANNYKEALRYYRAIMDYEYKSCGVHQYKTSIDAGHGYNYDFEKNYNFNWGNMFDFSNANVYSSSGRYRYEWIWVCEYDNKYEQINSLGDWFSSNYGSYVLKPSQLSMNNWKNQTLKNGLPGDLRGQGASWDYEGANPVAKKFLGGSNEFYSLNPSIGIYRTGLLHLRAAEAINRMGYPDVALALLNTDEGLAYDPVANKYPDNKLIEFVDSTIDFFGDPLSLKHENNLAYDYNVGVRGRVYVAKPTFSALTKQDSINRVEEIISTEYALEAAYEGDRWANLLRMAKRRISESPNDGVDFLANAIAAKFEASGDAATAAAIKAKLKDQNNWFLPLPGLK